MGKIKRLYLLLVLAGVFGGALAGLEQGPAGAALLGSFGLAIGVLACVPIVVIRAIVAALRSGARGSHVDAPDSDFHKVGIGPADQWKAGRVH